MIWNLMLLLFILWNFIVAKRAKVMFLHVSVILSINGGLISEGGGLHLGVRFAF